MAAPRTASATSPAAGRRRCGSSPRSARSSSACSRATPPGAPWLRR
jgi:hypothetical protein